MKTKLMFAVLCAGGLALLAPPALAQPRPRGGAEDGPRAAAAEPTAREKALEQQVVELQMQIKRLQETLMPSGSRPEARPQAAEGERRGPAPDARRTGSPAQPNEGERRVPGFAARRDEAQDQPSEGRFSGRDGGEGRDGGGGGMGIARGGWDGGRDGMARGMRGQPSPPAARPGREGPAPFAGRAEGPTLQQGPRGPWAGQQPAFGRGEPTMRGGAQNVVAEVRQLLNEARMLIARAEQLVDRQAPRGEADRSAGPRGPAPRFDGRDGPPGPVGRGRFGPPAGGRFGMMNQAPAPSQPQRDGWQGPQGPRDGGGPWQRGPGQGWGQGWGQGSGFRGGRPGPGGADQDRSFGAPPGPRGEGRFGPPRSNED
jgi:hypothetical protein